MPLTDIAVRNAKGREKPYKMADGGGLYLLVKTNGARYWRFDYRFEDARKTLAIGVYPKVDLKTARTKHQAAQQQIEDGKDPGAEKKREKTEALEEAAEQANTFAAVADQWFQVRIVGEDKGERTCAKMTWLLGLAKADLGDKLVTEIKPSEVLRVLKKVEAQGHNETAFRLRSTISRVFRYAIAHDMTDRNPAGDLQEALTAPVVEHHAGITDPRKLGPLLRAIDGYQGEPTTVAALKLAPYLFLRPGELRMGEWHEVNWNARQWRIPGDRMKMKLDHIVPLSEQAFAMLKAIHPLTGQGRFIFPSLQKGDRPLSENTLNGALIRLGYDRDEQTPHGFRTTASTLLNENGWNSDWIEKQLAHEERNKVRGSYNAAQYLPDRTRMMQWWANYLDGLKSGAQAQPLPDEILELIG